MAAPSSAAGGVAWQPLTYLPFAGKELTAVAGWGRKKSFRQAHKIAKRRKLPCFTLEDGFLRSVGLGYSDPPLSIVVDALGIYYDADSPSRLETLISQSRTDAEVNRARQISTNSVKRPEYPPLYWAFCETAEHPVGIYRLLTDKSQRHFSILISVNGNIVIFSICIML